MPRDSRVTDDRLDFHLWNWANWHRSSVAATVRALWYPAGASGMAVSHGSDFDGMVAEVDHRCAEAVESALDDCPTAERCAVHHVHLHAVYRPRIGLDAAYGSARLRLAAGLDERGIL